MKNPEAHFTDTIRSNKSVEYQVNFAIHNRVERLCAGMVEYLLVKFPQVVVCVDVVPVEPDGQEEVVFCVLQAGHQRADVVVRARVRRP